jgi:hypothetical protein
MNREEWLALATDALRGMFKQFDFAVPAKIRASCGWPSTMALRRKKTDIRAIGQCWATCCSADGTSEIFISPCLGDAFAVLEVLVHELVHAIDDCKDGHGRRFRKIALKVGLAGPMVATTAGPELQARLNTLTGELGPYPHATLDRLLADHMPQSTRMKKVVCGNCGYTVRTTRYWLTFGLPTCVCGTRMQEDLGIRVSK